MSKTMVGLLRKVNDTAGEVFTYDLESCVRKRRCTNPSPAHRDLTV